MFFWSENGANKTKAFVVGNSWCQNDDYVGGVTYFILFFFFTRKLFQSTSLYIKGILGGRPATLCLVKSGNVTVFIE